MPSNSSKNLVGNLNLDAKEKNWIIENLPITVFRISNKSSWGIEYINENVENMTGYSKKDFLSRKLSWLAIVFKEDIPKIEKSLDKARKIRLPIKLNTGLKHPKAIQFTFLRKAIRYKMIEGILLLSKEYL